MASFSLFIGLAILILLVNLVSTRLRITLGCEGGKLAEMENNKLRVIIRAKWQLRLRTIREMLHIVGILLAFLLMVVLALGYELKQSYRSVFLGEPPASL